MAPLPAVQRRRLTVKFYILAALTATLLTAAIIVVIFVVLSPARLHFSVAHADHCVVAGGREVLLSVTLAANNPSRRTSVRYQSMYVDVRNSSRSTTFFHANVTMPMPLQQPTDSVTTITASLSLVEGPLVEAVTSNITNTDFLLTVIAVARFKVGIACTRLYNIKVSCGPVEFFSEDGRRRRIDCQ